MKNSLCIVLSLFVSGMYYSQSLEIGFLAGLGRTASWTSPGSNKNFGFSTAYGLSGKYQISKKLSANAEVLHMARLNRSNLILTDQTGIIVGTAHVTHALQSVSLPLYAAWGFGGSKLRLMVKAGLVMDYAFSSNHHSPIFSMHGHPNGRIKDPINKPFDIGPLLGLGFSKDLGKRAVFNLDFRSLTGLLNHSMVSNLRSFRNNVMLTAGFSFRLVNEGN